MRVVHAAVDKLLAAIAPAIGADPNEVFGSMLMLVTDTPMHPPTVQRVDNTQRYLRHASIAKPKAMPVTVPRFGMWNSTLVRIIVGDQWLATHYKQEWADYCAAVLTNPDTVRLVRLT